MKVFKDLKVGDIIYVGFEKKEIAEIKLDHPFIHDTSMCTIDGNWYVAPSYLPFNYNYSIDGLIATDKEAIIKYYAGKLTDIQREFEYRNAYLIKMLEKARTLE